MTTDSLAASPRADTWAGLRPALLPLAAGLVLFAVLFHAEAVAAVHVWIESTAYNHGFLILPIVAWLLWDRRARLAGAVARPMPMVALAAIPVAVVWLLADRLGIMEGRQLMAMTLLQLLLVGVLGWPVYRLLIGPFLYLYFLVPFGAFVTPALQNFTTDFVGIGLNLIGIPNYIDAHLIQIPEGAFYVAQACAGLRFLIAAVAFGALYALLMYRSPLRRAVFIGVSVVVPVIANGFRALGIVALGHYLGSAQAAATDHVLYGWIFFSIVILLLVLLGLPFREDLAGWAPPAPPPSPPRRPPGRPIAAMLAVGVIAALGPLAALGFDRAAAADVAAAPLPLPAGACQAAGPASVAPGIGAARMAVQRFVCQAHGQALGVRVVVERFSPRSDPAPMLLEERRLSGRLGAEDVVRSTMSAGGLLWRVIETSEPTRTTAFLLWIDGSARMPDLRTRIRQGIASLFGGGTAPVLVAVAADSDPSAVGPQGRQSALTAIAAYLVGQPDLKAELARLSAGGR